MEKGTNSQKKKFQLPHIYVILFIFSALAAISTYFIPAGEFERVPGPEGRTAIDPNSFSYVESAPIGIADLVRGK